jgi:hypothetical protein
MYLTWDLGIRLVTTSPWNFTLYLMVTLTTQEDATQGEEQDQEDATQGEEQDQKVPPFLHRTSPNSDPGSADRRI